MAEDKKYKFENGQFVNRVSGEAIPDGEPVIIFRARDRHALTVLRLYYDLVEDEHHSEAVHDRLEEFHRYAVEHPHMMKEPGISRHMKLNRDGD